MHLHRARSSKHARIQNTHGTPAGPVHTGPDLADEGWFNAGVGGWVGGCGLGVGGAFNLTITHTHLLQTGLTLAAEVWFNGWVGG